MLILSAMQAMHEASQADPERLEQSLMRLKHGDESAFADIYAATDKAVFGYALSILRNVHDAEDVMHDAYLKLWQNADRYEPMGKPMAWILTIAKRLCLMRIREKGRSFLPLEEAMLPSDSPLEEITLDRLVLETALEVLTGKERQIVMLHITGGLKHREIAEFMDMTLSAVLSKYSRALKRIRNAMEERRYAES